MAVVVMIRTQTTLADDIHLAVAIHVVADDRESGFLQIPIAVPLPFVMIGVDIFEPAVRREQPHPAPGYRYRRTWRDPPSVPVAWTSGSAAPQNPGS